MNIDFVPDSLLNTAAHPRLTSEETIRQEFKSEKSRVEDVKEERRRKRRKRRKGNIKYGIE